MTAAGQLQLALDRYVPSHNPARPVVVVQEPASREPSNRKSMGEGYARLVLGPKVPAAELDAVLLATAEAQAQSDDWRDVPSHIRAAFVDLYG